MTAATAYQSLGEKVDERARLQKAPIDEDDLDHHRNAPIPDAACLYGLVGDIARAGSADTEANPYAIALNVLAYLGCCLGRGPFLPVGNTYHHGRLFGMHVGRSGRGRKGDAVSLIHRIDLALRAKHPDLAPQVHRGGLSSREGLAFLIHDGYREGKNEVEPLHDKRLWVIESEFANVLHQTKRDGNTLSSALRDCWDGVTIKPATKSNRIAATDPHVSLSAAVTTAELLSLIEARELSNGFANRFLTIFAERTRLVPFPKATPQDEVNRLAERIREILKFAGADRWADKDHKRMSLSPAAAKRYAELYLGELNRQDFGSLVTGLLERRAPVMLRIAMIFALTDMTATIEPKHIEAALGWVRLWADSIRFIFSSGAQEQAQGEVAAAAGKIIEFLRERGRQSRTKINIECFRGKLSKDRLDDALDELLHATPPVIEIEVERRTDGPGSPTKFYRLAANSAKSAALECPRGFADGSTAGEVSETREVSAATAPTVRSIRQTAKSAESLANAHDSLNSLDSPAHADTGEI
jgi:hypothetical protein